MFRINQKHCIKWTRENKTYSLSSGSSDCKTWLACHRTVCNRNSKYSSNGHRISVRFAKELECLYEPADRACQWYRIANFYYFRQCLLFLQILTRLREFICYHPCWSILLSISISGQFEWISMNAPMHIIKCIWLKFKSLRKGYCFVEVKSMMYSSKIWRY